MSSDKLRLPTAAPHVKRLEHMERILRFHAPVASASASGDYYQLSFGPEESDEAEADPYVVSGPYLIVQRQFEMPDRGRCYIETHDESYIGHFRLRLSELTRTRLAFDIGRRKNNQVKVSFVLNALELQRTAEIIFGLREPVPDDDDPF
jgi:hypothetical protein